VERYLVKVESFGSWPSLDHRGQERRMAGADWLSQSMGVPEARSKVILSAGGEAKENYDERELIIPNLIHQ
jgi:hypothetical protein